MPDSKPAAPGGTPPDHPGRTDRTARNARYGLVLFVVYVALYGGFMGLSAFKPEVMASRPLFGVNLAILYGIGLILAALVLAFVYMFLCRQQPGDREGAA